jgi:hypothetical protein
MVKYFKEDARKFYRLLRHTVDEYTEIRVISLNNQGTLARTWVQNEDDFLKFCGEWSGKAHVYAGINPRPTHGAGKNDHINRSTIIPIDIDVDKPTGSAASQEELDQAKEQVTTILKWFNEKGFDIPYIDMSGNGYHILIAVDLII